MVVMRSNIRRIAVVAGGGTLLAGMAVAAVGCVRVHTDPIEVKPITLNVNVNVKVDRQLDDFFGFASAPATPTTVPAGDAGTVPTSGT